MSKGIKLSPKHGLNPSQVVCFYCGEVKELALMGRLKGDAKAPDRIVADLEPCQHCKDKMAKGTTLLEVSEYAQLEGMPSINDKQQLYPTGRWCVLRSDIAKELFKTDDKIILLHSEVYNKLLKKD